MDAHGLDIAIVITDQTDGKSSMDFADDYYDSHGFGIGGDASGLLLLINMDIREVWISTAERQLIFLPTAGLTACWTVTPHLSDEDYYSACMEFIHQAEKYAKSGVPRGNTGRMKTDILRICPQGTAPILIWAGQRRRQLPVYVIALVIAPSGL